MEKKLLDTLNTFLKYILIIIGSAVTACALELFLVPNNLIDGGVVGISIMLSYITKIPLSAYILILNIPFLIVGYKHVGKNFVISTLFSIACLSVFTSIFETMSKFTDDLFLTSVFGGLLLGMGVGLIIRYGGSLDGTEIVAIIFSKKTSFSVGEIVMFFNVFILGSVGFLFGWDRAMYSIITYLIAFKAIDLTIKGFDESKAAIIVSNNPDQLAHEIMEKMQRGVTYLEGSGGYSKNEKKVLYVVINRLEVSKLKSIVNEFDENAFVTISGIHEVIGGKVKKKRFHH
ncbi:YitT family protein [Methanococcus sp. CF]